jgi:hypothetical protein
MKRYAALAVSLVAMAAVVSCGGGGDDVVGAPSSGPSAEGYYAGTLSVSGTPLPGNSTDFQLLVLENGQLWTIYGVPNAGALQVQAFAQGTGNSNGSLFIASNVRYFSSAAPRTAVVSINYNAAAKTASGSSLDDANSTVSFTSAPLGVPAYDYATPAALTSVQGAWTVDGLAGDQYTLAVDGTTGAFTGTPIAPATCAFSGTFVPRTSGKNVFTVQLTNGVAPCTNANLVSSGIAFVSPLTGGRTQLTFATVSSSPSSGAVLSGVRP